MSRIVGIYFNGRNVVAQSAEEGHKEVAERICRETHIVCPKGDPVDFLISRGGIKLGNRYGDSKIVVFKGSCIDNEAARVVEHYMCEGWTILDIDQEVNWQF